MTAVLLNVAYCAEHWKGNRGINRQHGQTHAEWLEQCLRLLRRRVWWKIIVSATGWPGICQVETSEDNRERDVMWGIMRTTEIVGMPPNPSHQEGAAWCIRQGLEYASKMGFEYLVHTAEDIVPHEGALLDVERRLRAGAAYVGEQWGAEQVDLNSQFFGVHVPSLVGTFDPAALHGAGFLERYLARQLEGKSKDYIGRIYEHSHDYEEWKRMAGIITEGGGKT